MLGHKKDKSASFMGHKANTALNAIGNKHNYGHNNPVNFMNKDKDTIHDNKNMSMTFPLGLSKK